MKTRLSLCVLLMTGVSSVVTTAIYTTTELPSSPDDNENEGVTETLTGLENQPDRAERRADQDMEIVEEDKELTRDSNNLTIRTLSNEILPDISKWSEFWDKYEAPVDIQKAYPYYHSGYDFEGNPIWIEETGKWNIRKSVEAGGETFKHFDKHSIQSMYRMVQSINRSSTPDNPVSGVVFILDFDGLTLDQLTHIPTLSYMVNLMRQYFALIQASLYHGIIINANAVAHSLLNIMRPVLGRVFEKVEIYGTNKSKFIPHILKRCPKDSIPEWYGGSKDFKPVQVFG